MSNNCCNDIDNNSVPDLNIKYINNALYYTYNGKTEKVVLPQGGDEDGGNTTNVTLVTITTNAQNYFNNIITEDQEILYITINGHVYYSNSYVINGRNLTWTGSFALETSDTLLIITKE